jgi:hypothetical protein
MVVAADLFCDEAFQIVFASHLVPLIVTQHRETGNTTFWLLRKRASSTNKLSYERARARATQCDAAVVVVVVARA